MKKVKKDCDTFLKIVSTDTQSHPSLKLSSQWFSLVIKNPAQEGLFTFSQIRARII